MAPEVSDTYADPPATWPDARELLARANSGVLLLLPEQAQVENNTTIAPFRSYAQDLRVLAREQGHRAELVVPDGAQPAVYSEHAAEWVLPVVFSVPATVAANLIAVWIDRRLRGRGRGEATPIVRYREARIVRDQFKVREIEGPADKVRDMLRDDNWSSEAPRAADLRPGTSTDQGK